ncbi:MAG: flavin reductase family protein [Nocardioidaceae bacterium]
MATATQPARIGTIVGPVPPAGPMNTDTFRAVMGGFATGVAIVTTCERDQFHGMTLNSLTAVSLRPIRILVCLTRGSRTAEAVVSRGWFVVNLLTDQQRDLSNAFARQAADHFADVDVDVTPEGLPVLPGGLGHLVCAVDRVDDGGDHLIVLAEVNRAESRDGEPLVFHRGRYGRYHPFAPSVRDVGFDWFG